MLLAVAYDRMMTSRLSIGLALFLGLAVPVFAQGEFVARVLMVHEGDQFTIYHQGRRDKIYLKDIDCPDPKQPYGKQAKHVTAAYIGNREVIIRDLTQDRQGRMTAEILLPNGKLLTHELIKEGLAWAQPNGPNVQTIKDMEELARAAAKGLWSESNPIPPWKWKPTKPAHRN